MRADRERLIASPATCPPEPIWLWTSGTITPSASRSQISRRRFRRQTPATIVTRTRRRIGRRWRSKNGIGAVRKGFQGWGEAFHLARGGDPAARDLLLKLVDEPATPAVARATALIEAQRLPSISVEQAASSALDDPDPLVRIAALRAQSPSAPLDRVGGARVPCCPIRYGRCASRPPACSPTSPRMRSRRRSRSPGGRMGGI